MTNKEELLQIITRLERLEEERAAVSQDITDILADSKIKGYDTKILKQILTHLGS